VKTDLTLAVNTEIRFRKERRERLCAPSPSLEECLGALTVQNALLVSRLMPSAVSPTAIRESLVDIMATCAEMEGGLD
jgi:hypothetical protein